MKPEPLTPPDLDLRDFEWMPLQVVRLRDSGIVVVASAEAFRAAVLLWCASWHQVPAASLPNDEKMLCSLAGFGRDLRTWRGLSAEALHGFIECSDGRLYHPVIAEKAIESGSKKKKQGRQTAAATEAARLARLARDAERNGVRNGVRDDNVDGDGNGLQERGPDRTGQEKTKIEPENKGESHSRPDLKVVQDEKPQRIDENYVPSDRAVEYAFSLGMKKTDLNSELSKFIATSMAAGAVSFNIDMSFKVWCDRWLEFKLKKDPNWKPTPAPAEPVHDARADWPIVIEGTTEHLCWNIYNREHGLRPLFLCKQLRKDGTIVDRAARCETLFPPGFNDFGERISPDAEDAA